MKMHYIHFQDNKKKSALLKTTKKQVLATNVVFNTLPCHTQALTCALFFSHCSEIRTLLNLVHAFVT